jgi:hypothetical protein
MNMLCAIPNAIYMESGGKQKIVNGEVLAPESPGTSSEVSKHFYHCSQNRLSQQATRIRCIQ